MSFYLLVVMLVEEEKGGRLWLWLGSLGLVVVGLRLLYAVEADRKDVDYNMMESCSPITRVDYTHTPQQSAESRNIVGTSSQARGGRGQH